MLRKAEAFDEERFWSGQAKPSAAPPRSVREVAGNGPTKPSPAAARKTKPAAARGPRRQEKASAR
jgi:hypothetical protein